jgi:hypothetical protein
MACLAMNESANMVQLVTIENKNGAIGLVGNVGVTSHRQEP